MLCPGRSAFKGGGVGGEGAIGRAGEASGRARAKSGERRPWGDVLRAERSGLEGLVISRGKSVPLGLGTLS